MTNEERSAKYLEAAEQISKRRNTLHVRDILCGESWVLYAHWAYYFSACYISGGYSKSVPLSLCFAAAMAEAGDL